MPSFSCTRLHLVLLLSLLWFSPVFGQLRVESISLDDGAVDVPETLTLEIVFSAPLLPTLPAEDLLGGLENLPLGLDVGLPGLGALSGDATCDTGPVAWTLIPEGCPETATLSDDRRTLTLANIPLEAETAYTFLVLQAASVGAQVLDRPYQVRFTTGSTLPGGEATGTVTATTGTAEGTMVGLIPQEAFSLLSGLDLGGLLGGGDDSTAVDPQLDAIPLHVGIVEADGSYAARFVPDGSYLALALDLYEAPETLIGASLTDLTVPLGGYDGDGDQVLDFVTITDGGSVTDVNITTNTDVAPKARGLLDVAGSVLTGGAENSALTLALGLGLDREGGAVSWTYLYSGADSAVVVTSIGDQVTPGVGIDLGLLQLLIGPLEEQWNDSDTAVSDALNALDGWDSGGDLSGFTVLMDRSTFEFVQLLLASGEFGNGFGKHRLDLATPEAVGVVWITGLLDLDTQAPALAVTDANSAEPLVVIASNTAGDNLTAADAAAAAFADSAGFVDEAQLISVSTETREVVSEGGVEVIAIDGFEVSPTGESLIWTYTYYYPSQDSVQGFQLSWGRLLDEVTVPRGALPSLQPLPDGWINSNDALAALRTNRPDVFDDPEAYISTQLTRGYITGDPDQAVWRVWVRSREGDPDVEAAVLDVDALTNVVLVATEDEAPLAAGVRLEPGYPNPLSESTRVTLHLDQPTEVELAVYDVLGRRVDLLMGELKEPGRHTVTWTPGSIANGLYFIRLTTPSELLVQPVSVRR